MDARLNSLFRPTQANGRVASHSYAEWMPTPLLKPYVSCYWTSEPRHASEVLFFNDHKPIDRVLPDGCSDIIFEHDIIADRYQVRYCGMFDQPFAIAYDEQRPIRRFAVRFFPGGAYFFLQTALIEFTNQHLDLELVWPGIAGELGEQIFETKSVSSKIQSLEYFLLSMLDSSRQVNDDLMKNLLYPIFMSGGTLSVHELAKSEGISPRHMNRKFDQWIGKSPKKFSEIVRFQTALSQIHLRLSQKLNWQTLALDCGFFDQAHFIREFKRYYGDSPLVAVAEYQGMSDLYNPL
ncbi:helix-turn-helix domain-containing protein [Paenibacillus eucommiae]|uniref:AraC-like DNA-binding protein n=1 Tax=Paenibacillus eucommiae TaxID=1355755 RepID=A0ABS4IST9_9BACL|nr:helix-turn-helix domain-containing protein [Paenibacillus eucommiae]MBP1990639.1 AraC-like DNA-binding protein [Paenibacillus eucommiae]